jgi:hypothetical protein
MGEGKKLQWRERILVGEREVVVEVGTTAGYDIWREREGGGRDHGKEVM